LIDFKVPGDVLKLLGEGGMKTLKKLINTIYETGEWLKDFTEVTMIALKKKLLDDLGDRRGYSHLKEEALDHTKWRNHFGRGFGPVI
jgi:hypothetical protein